MCNRYVTPDEATIERYWHIGRGNQWRGEATLGPRTMGPFLRPHKGGDGLELVVGQWGLIPWFAETPKLRYATNNARYEELAHKACYKQSWLHGRRCIIPAWSFDEPCWETGRNVWWRFERADGAPWGLAGLWNRWTDKATGEVVESYTMLTINADAHPLMSRMHRPDPTRSPDQQDKRSVVAIEFADVQTWLKGDRDEASLLAQAPSMTVIAAAPIREP